MNNMLKSGLENLRAILYERLLSLAATALLICMLLFAGGVMNVSAAGQQADQESGEVRIFDQAGLFSDTETGQLTRKMEALRSKTGMDAVFVTTDDAEGRSTGKYAEYFYEQGNFGVGKDYSGVLFLIDMDNQEIYLLPVGKMNRYLTDERRNTILDDAFEGISDGDYMACAQSFIDGVSGYYDKGIPSGQYNYDEDTGKVSIYRSIRWYEALLALAVAAMAAVCACGGVVSRYSMKRERNQSMNYLMEYRSNSAFIIKDSKDDLINKTVTHVIIPKNNNSGGSSGGSSSGRSTTHTSSGRTYGGGGRKF